MTRLYTWRRLLNGYLRQESIAGKLRQRILVVGWTAYAQRLTEIIENDPSHRYKVVCCVPTPEGSFQINPPQGITRYDGYDAIGSLLNTHALDIVLVTDAHLPKQHHRQHPHELPAFQPTEHAQLCRFILI
jgi:hypothetical protein